MKKNLKSVLCIVFLAVSLFGIVGCKDDEKFDSSAKIQLYTRDKTSGTRDGFFTNIHFTDAVGDNSVLGSGILEAKNNGAMVESVKNDEYGIGYISLSSLKDSGLKGLIYEGVAPTEENVLNGSYKLTRNFNYIVRNEFATEKEQKIVEAFLAFLKTSDALITIQSKDGIVDITGDEPSWDSIKDNYPICLEDNSNITIKFGGSTSVEKIANELSREFSTKCGNFVAEHNHTGSGDAYKFTQGEGKDSATFLHIAFASREFKITEQGAEGTYGKICVDAIVAVVNEINPLDRVTADMLKKIYDGTYSKWEEVK